MRRLRSLAYAGLAALGLALYLVPAFTAPVVSWSDSTLDLEWARKAEGIVTPVVSPHHPPKPGYILFLRGILAAGPESTEQLAIVGDAERRIVIVQSILLWFGIASAALILGRRLGARYGVLLYLVLVLSLRLRDCASTIMSEALTAAILLPLAALLLDPPARGWTSALFGAAAAGLFLIRPNAGAAILLLAVVSLWIHRVEAGRKLERVLALVFGFAVLWAPFWYATRVPGDPFRGMAPAFVTGSLDYSWTPPHPGPEPPPFDQVRTALANWRTTLTERSGDRGRQLVWRALHGLLGTDYYDARWSEAYAGATALSRTLAPLLTLAAITVLLVAPPHGPARLAKLLGLTLLALLVAQSLVLGALPRLALPFLPALILAAVAALPGLRDAGPIRLAACAGAWLLLIGLAAWQRHALDWEWGLIEKPGVHIVQEIPRGGLPQRTPATLHLRIFWPSPSPNSRLRVTGPAERLLYDERGDPERNRPYITVRLPMELLEENRRHAVSLDVWTEGDVDPLRYALFPVIPTPWAAPAKRQGSVKLSPGSGIASGSFDWWAHEGTR